MRISSRTAFVLCVAAIAVGTGSTTRGQQPLAQSVSASGATLPAWASRVEDMLRDGTLDVAAIQADTMIGGRVHERLAQRHEGLPVFGGELIRQMNGPTVLSVFGRIFENVSLATTTPAIEASAAAALAEAAAGPGASAGEPELGILPTADGYLLVYRLVVRSPLDVRRYDVNAITGAIAGSLTELRHQDTPAVGKGTGVLNDEKKISTRQLTGGFEAVDLLRPSIAFTLDFGGSIGRLSSFLQTGSIFPSDTAFNSSNTWTDGAIVDGHVYEGWVYDYYFKRFGRRGLDDRNTSVTSIVHPLARSLAFQVSPSVRGTFINNAFYLHPGLMFYGDGDGFSFDYFSGGFDVVAHELTHGVTSFTSDFEYQDEPGALNEAFSDIMATGAEFFHFRPGQGPQEGPNFLLAEDITFAAPGFIRSLQNPISAGDPDHYSLRQFIGTPTDNGGVHVNSTIVGHAFFLSVAGGTNRVSGITVQGIGVANIERMEKIFFRAFVFLMGPLSQFSDARAATLQAASDLFGAGSNERAQIQQAWIAVGVQ